MPPGAIPLRHRKLDEIQPQSLRFACMTTIRNPAEDAKAMLGPTGELQRVAALAYVYPRQTGWIVRTPSADGLDFCITGFVGPSAFHRAVEYASEKYAGVLVLEHEP